MEDSLPEDCDITVGGANIKLNQSECICTQPTATGDMDDITSPLARPACSLSLRPSSSSSDTQAFPLHHNHRPSCLENNLSCKSPAPLHTGPAPFKADPAHIKEAAGDDLCLRCVLSCLFCELLSMCYTLEACLACPGGGAICCCEATGCCCSGEEACQAPIGEDCSCSTDLLDFCSECCSFFFGS